MTKYEYIMDWAPTMRDLEARIEYLIREQWKPLLTLYQQDCVIFLMYRLAREKTNEPRQLDNGDSHT